MDTDDVLDLMRRTAEEIITPRFRSLTEDEVFAKRPGDLVTIADREAELAMTPVLQRAFPDALILGEEASETNPQLLSAFMDAEHSFTIDPIDGTGNFVRGSDDHAVMVAELRDGEVVRAWIWQPQHQTSLVAERGGGTWRNGMRLPQLTTTTDPSRWRGASSHPRLRGRTVPPLAQIQQPWGCAGIDYANLVAGMVDYVVFNKAKPWDHAPGALLLTEVGGSCVRLDGSNYRAVSDRPGLICGANAAVTDSLRAMLWPSLTP